MLSRRTADGEASPVKRRALASRFRKMCAYTLFELRICITWTWVLPAVAVLLILTLSAVTGTPLVQRPAVTRQAMEIGMPLIGASLITPLLEQEQRRATCSLLAMRTPLVKILLIRLALVMTYLGLIIALAAILSAPHIGDIYSDAHWVALSLFIVLIPCLFLGALSLLGAHSTRSATVGYVLSVAFWFSNLIAALALPISSALRSMLLFSWSFPPSPGTLQWSMGKCILLLGAMALLAAQPALLHQEAQFLANSRD